MNGGEFTLNPWEVKGQINYDKLIKDFGLNKIELEKLPKPFKEFLLFRRNIIFAHRDFGRVISAYENKKPFVMMTGLMPSGPMHLGHKMLAEQMIFYQKLGAKVYVTVADIEAYNSRNLSLKESREIAIEHYLTNYVALGLDLNKCDFYFQSSRSKDGVKASKYYSLASILSRHVTYNEMSAIYGDITPGKMSSALLQASDMLHPQLKEFEGKVPVVVPVGTDQDPHIRLARDLSQRIKEYDFMQISSTYHTFCPGLKGGKMSSSDPLSHIALLDDSKTAVKKVNKYAFSGGKESIEEHRKLGGDPDVDVAFQMLKYGLEEDDKKLNEIYISYKSGSMLSGELKAITNQKLIQFLDSHNKAREKAKKIVDNFVSRI